MLAPENTQVLMDIQNCFRIVGQTIFPWVDSDVLMAATSPVEPVAFSRAVHRLASAAWGWDLDQACRIDPPENGMAWTNWDVRLAKMCRSVYLLEQGDMLASLQKFARDLQENEKETLECFGFN